MRVGAIAAARVMQVGAISLARVGATPLTLVGAIVAPGVVQFFSRWSVQSG
jgi:hypothetical protein